MQKTYTNMHMQNSQFFRPRAFKLQISEQQDASPCAGKHSSTSSEKKVVKAFFDITFYCKQGCKLPIIYTWKAKTLFCLSFIKPNGPVRVYTCQNGHATPLTYSVPGGT